MPSSEVAAARAARGRSLRAARALGEVLLTLGVVVVLYVVYELYGTDLATEHAQRAASTQLDRAWVDHGAPATPTVGDPIARIRIPALGPDWSFTVLEGTDQTVLARGVGHYAGTPMPGEPGNVALAGHRVGHGAPFDALDDVHSCDPIIVETRDAWLTYRVLPLPDEVATWARDRGERSTCTDVPTPSGDYLGVTGRDVVLPTQTDVLDTVPRHPTVNPEQPERLLTITTCHPRFSARQRLVIHAVLTAATAKPSRSP